MYKKISDGTIIQVTDDSRVKFRTNISKAILDELTKIAEANNTYVNYLIENGLENLLSENIITFNKELRPKDRVQYKTSYDKKLLETVKKFASDHQLYMNDVIEYSTKYIDVANAKKRNHRNRVV